MKASGANARITSDDAFLSAAGRANGTTWTPSGAMGRTRPKDTASRGKRARASVLFPSLATPQHQACSITLHDGRVQQQKLRVRCRRPVQSPFEHRQRLRDRKRIERRDAIDDELHFGMRPFAQATDPKHAYVNIGEIGGNRRARSRNTSLASARQETAAESARAR
jgi:hypothetical protein